MNKLALTLLTTCCLSTSCFASSGNVIVKTNDTYTVGNPTAPAMPERPKGANGIPQPKSNFKFVK